MKVFLGSLTSSAKKHTPPKAWRAACLLVSALALPMVAHADPGPIMTSSEEAPVEAPGEAYELDMVGEPVPDEVLNLAADVHRARNLQRMRHYTSAPGEGILSGVRLGMSAGHGIHWDNGAWRFQRSIVDYSWGGVREDIHTNQIMIDFLLDMVERAGAETITMRARNYGETSVVIDNDDGSGYEEDGEWQTGGVDGFGGTYRFASINGGDDSETATARWKFQVEEDGEYPVYAFFLASDNRTDAAKYKIKHVGGTTTRTLSQAELLVESASNAGSYPNNPPGSGASRSMNDLWHYVGTFPFKKGVNYSVELSNEGADADKVIIADAIRIGDGMGSVKGGNGSASGRPRWEEASVPYIDWLGAPSWLRTGDVARRPLYSIYRGVDAYVAIHSDAGGGKGTSTYSWYDGQWVHTRNWPANWAANNLPPGTVEWGDKIHGEIIRQVRAHWDSNWTDRGRLGSDFGELRPFRQGWVNDKNAGASKPMSIPAALVELAFHDTEADARMLREVGFRHDVARGVLAGIIRHFKGNDAMIPPLPPSEVYTRAVGDELEVSWSATTDSVYSNSASDKYRVYTSPDGLLFDPNYIEVSGTSTTLPLTDCDPVYVRVTAVNDAGESLDSRVVGSAKPHEGGARVLYVDGVDRELKSVYAPNNPRTYARIYGPAFLAARDGVGFDMTTRDGANKAIAGQDYDVVVWASGETSTRKRTFSSQDQTVINELLERGTRILVSGAEIGWDLVEQGSSSDKSFFQDSLGAKFVADSAGTTKFNADTFGLGDLTFGDCSKDASCVDWPDVLDKRSGGEVVLSYPSGAAGVKSPDGQAILVGFPLETVVGASKRVELIGKMVDHLLEDAGKNAGSCPSSEPDPEPDPGDPDTGGGSSDAGQTPDPSDPDAGSTTPPGGDPDSGNAGQGPDAGGDAGDGNTKHTMTNDGCGCASTGDQLPGGALLFGALLAAAGIARRRR